MRGYTNDDHRIELMGHGLELAREGVWVELALHLRHLTLGDSLRLALQIHLQSGDHDAVEHLAVEADKLARDDGPTREEALDLLSRAWHGQLAHEDDCPRRVHGAAECLCLKGEAAQALADAGLDP